MRKIEEYKKLIKGFGFCFSQLKQVKPKVYEQFKKSIDILNENDSLFLQLVTCLKVDFLNENDNSDGEAQVVKQKNFVNEEFYGISYSPKDGYKLGLLYMKDTPIGFKKVFYDINSVCIEDLKDNEQVELFGVTTLDEKIQMDKSFVYVGELKGDDLIIFEVDLDNPNVYVRDFKIKLTQQNEADSEILNLF